MMWKGIGMYADFERFIHTTENRNLCSKYCKTNIQQIYEIQPAKYEYFTSTYMVEYHKICQTRIFTALVW